MSWRRISMTYVVAALLAGYLYLSGAGREPSEAVAPAASVPLVQAETASIDTLGIQSAGRRLVLRRKRGRWEIAAPGAAGRPGQGGRVSSDLVDALVETFTELPPIELVSHAEGAAAEFGLDRPAAVVSLAAGDSTVATVEVGDRSPTATAVYARRRGSEEIYLVGLNARYYVELLWNEVLSKQAQPG